jgi:regulator of protease activity HflC (stomatin/prohibitin superfamily)
MDATAMDRPAFQPRTASEQRPARAVSGPAAFAAVAVAGVVGAALLIAGASGDSAALAGVGVAVVAVVAMACAGFIVVAPNESKVLILLGRYIGTVTTAGWCWVNPLTIVWRETISLRVRNFQSDRTKVNDAGGSPIEIAAVAVWRVVDTAKAVFDVEDFRQFVVVQSETAVRHLASQFPYDDFGQGTVSLRGNTDEISRTLHTELQARLAVAGIEVLETRLTHLAYAAEIAQAMLRRQEAQAVVAARRTIVAGAVGLVDMALREISAQGVVELDEERKAAMVSNLMVVLSGDRGPTPVIDTGSLERL